MESIIPGVHYITNEAGERQQVVVPLETWERLLHELEVLREKHHVFEGLQRACREAKQQECGEMSEQCLGDFLDEL